MDPTPGDRPVRASDGRGGWLLPAAVGLVVPGSVLVLDPAGWFPFGPARWLATSSLVMVAFVALVARRRARVEPWLLGAAGTLVVAMALAAIGGLDPLYAWVGTPERHAGVVMWVVALAALVVGTSMGADRSPGARPGHRSVSPAVSWGVAVAAGGVGLAASAEALGWEPAVFDVGSRLSGTLGSSAFLGAAAALLLPATAGLALQAPLARRGQLRSAGHHGPGPRGAALRSGMAAVAAVGLVVALVGSGARAAWVGVAMAGLAVTAGQWRRLLRYRRPATFGALVVGALIVVLAVASPMGNRWSELGDASSPGGQGRLDEWRVATTVIARHPVRGVGPEGYRIAFAEGVDQRYEDRHGRDPLPDRAHSAPLDIWLAGGILALVAWVALVARSARYVWRALRSTDVVPLGLAAGLVAHGVGQLFLFPTSELEPLAWLLGGTLVASQARPGELRDQAAVERSGGLRWAPRWVTATRATVMGVAGTVAVGLIVSGGLGVAADRRAREASRSGSVAAAQEAVRLRPDVIRYHLLSAQLRIEADEGYHAALADVDRGLDISPRDPVLERTRARYLVGRALATGVPAHRDEARRYLDGLLARDPLNRILVDLARVLEAPGP